MKKEAEWSWFNDLALPHATMRLKQGVGRLIRTKKDVGIVAILDSRMTGKQYGRRILECLPGMRVIRSLNGINSLADVFDPSPEVQEQLSGYSVSGVSDSYSDSASTGSWRTKNKDIGELFTK
jgi:hypothetical protein